MKKMLLNLYQHFNSDQPKDWLDVLAPLVFLPVSVINLIVVSILFFSQNAIYDLDPKTYELILIATPEQRAIIGNQLVAYLFIGVGWVLVPLIRAIYTHKLPVATINYMLVASFGLYSIFIDNIIFFAIVIFVLLVKNTEIGTRISKIKETDWFKTQYKKFFPTIPR